MNKTDRESVIPSQWYLVQCKPRQELRAKQNLEMQGGTCLNFQHTVEKIIKGERATRRENLFPGYVFLRLSDQDPLWFRVRSTYGVSKMVAFGGRPLPIADQVVDRLKLLTSLMPSRPSYEKGQTVTITSGPFKGVDAIFSEYNGEKRALLLIRILQRLQSLDLPLTDFS